ncbi:hypothetical protein P7K49_022692, partial [Saguinus oedipus]
MIQTRGPHVTRAPATLMPSVYGAARPALLRAEHWRFAAPPQLWIQVRNVPPSRWWDQLLPLPRCQEAFRHGCTQ